MSIQAHLNSLEEKRTAIKHKISEEMNRPMPDFVLITNLKKENLALKEETQRYLIMLGKHSAATS